MLMLMPISPILKTPLPFATISGSPSSTVLKHPDIAKQAAYEVMRYKFEALNKSLRKKFPNPRAKRIDED